MRKLFVEEYDTMMKLSDRARNYLAKCDQGATRDLFGKCETIAEIEELVEELMEDEHDD